MKRICIVTSTRAEYGLLSRLTRILQADEEIDCRLVVTGAHLRKEYGYTVSEIEADGLDIDEKIDIMTDMAGELGVCQTMSNAIESFSAYFDRTRPDLLVVLGDRYETFAIVAAAINFRIPVAHLYGGETTVGAVDEAFRHSITKMSLLHFTAAEAYSKRVIQLGEEPDRVYTVGSMGIENIDALELMTKAELEASLGFGLTDKYAVGTFHPVTLEDNTAREQCLQLIQACGRFPDIKFLFTKGNADAGGSEINALMAEAAEKMDNMELVDSLGYLRYLSALKGAEFVIGNSSSGIVEAPAVGIPTVNIGSRQAGRLMADSIISCGSSTDEIAAAIEQALQMEKRDIVCPYRGDHPTERIAQIIKQRLEEGIDIQKVFYDL